MTAQFPIRKSLLTAHRGFTLIELLVVIGLIAVLSAGIGVALSSGDKGTALQNAQGIVGAVLSGARGQAAVNQASAAVFVNVDPRTDDFLRELRIGILDSSGNWRVVGESNLLDKGVYFVIDQAKTGLSSDVAFSGTWTNLHSTAYEVATPAVELYYKDGTTKLSVDGNDTKYRIVQIYSPRGVVDTAVPARPVADKMKLVLSSAQRGASPVLTFDNPTSLRGVLITDYGVSILVNEADAFKP